MKNVSILGKIKRPESSSVASDDRKTPCRKATNKMELVAGTRWMRMGPACLANLGEIYDSGNAAAIIIAINLSVLQNAY